MGEKDYNPQMHTLEHLLNGSIAKLLGCGRAFTTHIEKKKSKVDFACSRNLTEEEIQSLETKINDIISQNIAVEEFMMPIDEARKRFDLSRLPQEVEGDLRIIHIGDYDDCPCIGSHVEHTREIGGSLKIISSDYDDEKKVMRVRFKIV